MADSILRLKVESSEYDAKLKKAAEGIRHLADVAHKSGGDLTGLEKAELDYIRALGEMETKSRSAAGKVRELESTFKELKVIYDQLNDVEKADEGGKALAASLEQIKQRAQEARAQLDSASKSLNDNGQQAQQSSSMLDAMASKFTINIDALKLFDMGLKAAGVALDVAKDAFFASETNVDEWGRTIASAEGIYNSFLQSLNSGNFSDFLNNIGQVTQAARDAYNALDELGTRMTIINPERAKLQARQQELRATIRRNGQDSDVGKAALAELKQIEPKLSQSFKTESQMNRKAFERLVKQRLAEGGINLDQKSFRQFMSTFSSDAAFRRLRNNATGSITQEVVPGQAYNPNAVRATRTVDTRNTEQKLLDLFTDEWRKANSGYLTAAYNAQGAAASNALGNSRYLKETGGGSGSGSGSKTAKADLEKINGLIPEAEAKVKSIQEQIRQSWDEGRIEELNGELVKAQEELKRLQDLGKPIDFDKLFPMKNLENDQTSMPSLSPFDKAVESARVTISDRNIEVDQESIKSLLEVAVQYGLDELQPDFESLQETMADGLDIPDEAFADLQEKINEKLKEMGLDPINLDFKTGKLKGDEDEDKESYKDKLLKKINTLSGGLNSIASGLSSFGIELPKEISAAINVISGVGQIITGVSAVISLFSGQDVALKTQEIAQMTVLNGELTVLNSLLPELIAAEAIPFQLGGIVHAAQGFSGTVPGMSYSGDNIPIMANAGEVVLTRAQAGVIADAVSGGGGSGAVLYTEVNGDALRIVLDRSSRKRSKGRYMTTKMKN